MKKLFLLSLISGLLLYACRPEIRKPGTDKPGAADKVLVLCEGNFNWGNASLDLYEPSTDKVFDDMFQKTNGMALGDVLQSGIVWGNEVFLVLNNSSKIMVTDTVNFTLKNFFSGFQSPRYVLPVAGVNMLVTDLYSKDLKLIDRSSGAILSRHWVNGWCEEMLQYAPGKVAVCNQNGKIYFYDITNDDMEDSISVHKGSQWIVKDKTGMLWTLCKDSNPAIVRIDPINNTIKNTFLFTAGKAASQLEINAAGDTLFYLLDNALCAMRITDMNTSETPFFSVSGANFYGLGIHPKSGEIYVSDAADYVSRGTVYVLNKNGKERTHFKTGIIPNGFVFISP